MLHVLDPPGAVTLTIEPVWLENNSYPVTCNATEGNPPNSYTWSLNEQSHIGSTWTIQARKEYHQSVLYCHVTNNYTVTKQDNSFYGHHMLNVECKYRIIFGTKTICSGLFCTELSFS